MMKQRFLEVPARQLSLFADVRKGGGFEYVGAIMPVELFPDAYALGLDVAERVGVSYSMGCRIIGINHSMMFFYAYAFNRADPDDVDRAQLVGDLVSGGNALLHQALVQFQDRLYPVGHDLIDGVGRLLFDGVKGLVPTNPVLVLAALLVLLAVEEPREGLQRVAVRPDVVEVAGLDAVLGVGQYHRLAEIMEEAQSARAVILTGTGRVFSAGADLEAAREGLATSDVWERLSGAIAALPGLSVAALNGTLAGGAMGMALACDLRIAVPGARFFYPVMKLGFLPQPSDPARMAALIGPARTKMILMGGQKIDAEEARRFGLIDRIVEPEALLPHAQELVADTVAARPEIAGEIKAMCR